jgi:hypothetical protein
MRSPLDVLKMPVHRTILQFQSAEERMRVRALLREGSEKISSRILAHVYAHSADTESMTTESCIEFLELYNSEFHNSACPALPRWP